jgi:Gluconate 2-dehydrogenase subunit 3
MTPMRRRDFVKAMVAVPVTAKTMLGQQTTAPQSSETGAAAVGETPQTAAPPPAAPVTRDFRRGQSITFKGLPNDWTVPDAVASTETHFFSDEQLAALRKLCEILMPSLDGYPGATQAGAPEFLDFLIGVSPADSQQMYRSGLDHLNKEAKKQFGMPFAEVNAAQADALIRPLLAPWISDHPPAQPLMRFMSLAHDNIRAATMNSRAWSVAATASGERAPGLGFYWAPIDPDIEKNV